MKAVRKHTDSPWVLLYIERWLVAPLQRVDGSQEPRTRGTPQGSVVSPVLANLFLRLVNDQTCRHLPASSRHGFLGSQGPVVHQRALHSLVTEPVCR